MLKRIYLVLTLALIILLGFLYQRLVFNFNKELFSKREMTAVSYKTADLSYDIAHKESLFLKIKAPEEFPIKKALFNNKRIYPAKVKLKKVTCTYYFIISKSIVFEGINLLRAEFLKHPSVNIDIRLYNYRKDLNGPSILFSDNHIFKNKKSLWSVLFVTAVLIFIYFILAGALRHILLSYQRIYLYIFLSLLPVSILLTLVYLIPLSSGYRIVMSRGYFFSFQFTTMLMFLGLILFFELLRAASKKSIQDILSPLFTRNTNRILMWIKIREFSDKCILLFMFLLINCALFLILSLEPAAEQLANIAYFALVTGVVIKFVKMVREERRKD